MDGQPILEPGHQQRQTWSSSIRSPARPPAVRRPAHRSDEVHQIGAFRHTVFSWRIEKRNEHRPYAHAPATKFGFESDLCWTVGRLHAVLVDRFNVDVSEDTVWRRLREAGLTWQTPERQYFQADEETRRRWQEETIPKIRETLEKTGGILYCEDEASVCLTPLLGKTWAERGKPRKVAVTGARVSIAALSALSPKGRLVFRLSRLL